MVSVGSSALQEHRGDPHIDESTMSPEWHKQQTVLTAVVIIIIIIIITGSTNINTVSVLCLDSYSKLQLTLVKHLEIWFGHELRVERMNECMKSNRVWAVFTGKSENNLRVRCSFHNIQNKRTWLNMWEDWKRVERKTEWGGQYKEDVFLRLKIWQAGVIWRLA